MIPEGWEIFKLNQVTSKIGDGLHGTPVYDDTGDYFFINGSNLVDGKIELTSNTKRVNEKEYTKYKKELSDRTILLGINGTIGNVALYNSEKCILSKSAAYLNVINDFDKKFLKYILLNDHFQKYIKTNATGTTIKNVGLALLREYEFYAPESISIQRLIASILSSLDDKIELNLQMNKTLEAIAQAIYKEWFVDFRFPGFNGEMVDGLPKWWKLKSLKDILALLKDGSHNPPNRVEAGIRFIAGATDIKDLIVQFDKCTYITKDDYDKIHKNWEIQANDILLTIVGTIGNTAIVRESDLPFSLQRSIAVIRPIPEISHLYIYLLIKSKAFKNFLKSRTNPTGQPGIYLGTLSEYFALVPTKEVNYKFHEIQSPLFDMMQRNICENQILIEIRDSLLPKLMSGKIRVA